MKKADRTGKKYGKLLVLTEAGSRMHYGRIRLFWKCICDCGNELEVEASSLQCGNRKSCGCMYIEKIKNLNYKHGEANKTKENKAWFGIKERCYNPNSEKYHCYGGRGIKVCERWLNSYEAFLEDMGRAPSKDHSIDRINVNKDYEASNCRWATKKQQGRNTTKNVFIEFNGIKKTLVEWSEDLGYSYKYFHAQIKYKNKTIEDLYNKKKCQTSIQHLI